MNNNEKDNFFGKNSNEELKTFETPELKKNDAEMEKSKEKSETQKIEIPQKYYEQLEEKKRQEEAAAKQAELDAIKQKEESQESGKLLGLVFVFAVLTFFCAYANINVTELAPVGMLAIIVIATIAFALNSGKESSVPEGVLVGGILSAVLTFAMGMIAKDQEEIWTYYAVASGVIAVLGFVISKIITFFITDHQNIQAVQTIGIFVALGLIIGVPIFIKQKFPEEWAKYVLQKSNEIVAENEDEFVVKTLKYRYGKDFTCGNRKTGMDSVLHKVVAQYMCVAEKRNQQEFDKEVNNLKYDSEKASDYIIILSIPYNEGENKYIVEDNYIDKLFLNKTKETIKQEISKKISFSKINIYLYPNGNCRFVGDCADCDEYFAISETEKDKDHRFKTSSNLNYSKDINTDYINFMNNHEYKYIINIIGTFSNEILTEEDFANIVSDALSALNATGLKNTYGYEIYLRNSIELEKTTYHVSGAADSDSKFKDPVKRELT